MVYHKNAQLALQPCIVSFRLLPSRDAMVGHDLKDSKHMQLQKEKQAEEMKQSSLPQGSCGHLASHSSPSSNQDALLQATPCSAGKSACSAAAQPRRPQQTLICTARRALQQRRFAL